MRVNLDPLDGAAVPDALSVKEKMQQNQECIILQPIGLFATNGHKVQNLPSRRASYALEHNNTKKSHECFTGQNHIVLGAVTFFLPSTKHEGFCTSTV